MPTGRVQWYDIDRGYGFVTNPGSDDVYIGASVLPDGVEHLVKGQRVEYDFAAGRRGPQVLRVTNIEEAPARAGGRDGRGGRGGSGSHKGHGHKFSSEELTKMVQDVVTLLDTRVVPGLQAGRRLERKESRQIAEILRTIARELD